MVDNTVMNNKKHCKAQRVMCVTQFYPPDVGGMQISNSLLVEGLARYGCDIELHVFGHGENCAKTGCLTRYDHPNAPLSLIDHFKLVHTVLCRVNEWRPDIVMFLDEGPTRAFGLMPFVKKYGARIVSINSGSTLVRENTHFRGKINAWLVRRGYKWLDKMFISEDTCEKLTNNYPYLRPKLNIMGRPIPDYFYKNICEADSNSVPLLFSASRASEDKKIDLILYALKALRDKRGAEVVEFIYAGDGPELDKWKRIISDYNLRKVRFVGNVGHDEIIKYYDRSHFFILPSMNEVETFGRVWVEAFARKKPVISTNICNLKYLIKDGVNGFVVRPTVSSVTEGIERALSLNLDQYRMMCEDAYRTAEPYRQSSIVREIVEML